MSIQPTQQKSLTQTGPRKVSLPNPGGVRLPNDTFVPSENAVMGGDDSPCFYNGKVMTIREAKALAGTTTPTPAPTPKGESSWADIGLDPKQVMGGDDSPCFYNGKVMTIREAKALAAKEQAQA